MADVISIGERAALYYGSDTVNAQHGKMRTRPANFLTDSSPLYFDTFERPVFFQGFSSQGAEPRYYNEEESKAIVRLDAKTSKPICLGIVGKNYKVIPMKELCHEAERSFIEAFTAEQLDGCKVIEKIAYHGAQLHKQYIFPKISADIGSSKSNVAFRTIVVNGYDGASSFKLYSGAIDFFCENGMVTGLYDMTVKRHTKGLTIPSMIDKINRSIDVFYKQADIWKTWVKHEGITDEDAKACFSAMPGVSERRVDQLVRQFHIEALSHGRTVWALYSAATFYATHDAGEFTIRDTGKEHAAVTLMNRETQVRSWLATPEFQKIAA